MSTIADDFPISEALQIMRDKIMLIQDEKLRNDWMERWRHARHREIELEIFIDSILMVQEQKPRHQETTQIINRG